MKHSDLTKKDQATDESGIMYKAGVKKYGKDGMKKIQSAAGKGASAEEIGKIKDQHNKKKKESVQEDLALMAQKAEMDHEVQMARSDLYKAAKYSIKLHDMLKSVSEQQGLEGWVAAKITKASDYLSSVYHYMEYEMMSQNESVDPSKKKTEGPLDYLKQLGRDIGTAWDEFSSPNINNVIKGDDVEADNVRTIIADINSLGTSYKDIDPENLDSDVLYTYFHDYVLPGNEYLKPFVDKIPKNSMMKRSEWQSMVQKIMANKPAYGKMDRGNNTPQQTQTAQTGQTRTSQTVLGPDGQPAQVQASIDYKESLANKLQSKLEEAKKGLYYNVNKKKKSGKKPNPPGHPDRPSAQDWKDAAKTAKEGICSDCGKPSYTTLPEEKQKGVDGKVCWKGYKRMGTKMKGGKRVDNCVPIKKK